MIPITEITRTDYNRMLEHKKQAYYDMNQANDLMNLIRTYINPRQGGCFTCGNAFREAKTCMNEWLMANKEKIESILIQNEKPKEDKVELEEIKPIDKYKKK